MKIIQVVNVRWLNACAWYGLFLGKLLRDAGHEVLTLGIEDSPPMHQARAWGIPCRTLDLNTANPLALVRTWTELRRLVDSFRPDIVNCHRGEGFVLWGLLKKQTRTFRLVRTRGDQRPPKANAINRWLHIHAADAVVATNMAMTRHFRDSLGIPATKLRCIPGGVDTRRFAFDAAGRDRVRQEFGFGPEHHVIGLLGRFDLVKGQKETIAALSRLHHGQGLQQLRLLLIGFETATSQSQVLEWIREHKAQDIVRITGPRDDVAACISACDTGLVASLWSETIARAALEIMACGRPLVSTRVGVMPDLLPEEALIAPGDAPALERLLARSATDRPFRNRLLADQRQRMPGLSEQAFLSQTLDLYHSLITR